jgi:putative nucleotidyltransferase with HDIG domain
MNGPNGVPRDGATARNGAEPRSIAARLAVRRGEFVQLRRRILAQSWLWFAVLIVVGSALVVPWRDRQYPALTAGDVAPRDIVVRREVTLPDREATDERRRRASLEVRPVYQFDTGAAEVFGARIDALFTEGRRSGETAAAALARQLSAASGLLIEPREAEVLRAAEFTEELATVLKDIVSTLYRRGVVAGRAELLQSVGTGVTLRISSPPVERDELDIYRFVDGASLGELVLQRLASDADLPRPWRGPLADMLARGMAPNVTLDRGETLTRRLKAASAVAEVVVRLPEGRVVVRRGDEVTPQAARLLAALAEQGAAPADPLRYLGALIVLGLLGVAWYIFLQRESSSKEELHHRFGGAVILTVLMLLIERGFAFLAGSVATSMMRDPFGRIDVYLPVLPHAAGPMLAVLLFGLAPAIMFAVVQAVVVSLMLGGEPAAAMFAVVSGVGAALATVRLKERNVLARVGLVVVGINVVTIVGLTLLLGGSTGQVLAAKTLAGLVGGVASVALASFLLPVLESLTGMVTDIRLLELSNPNLPLLKRMSLEAPGTFQHSLAMANLAEAAAEAIGANPLLARVCCYYHDIGKLAKPDYFVENQRGANPHDTLRPWMSALIVSNHVKAGLELAREHRLPEPVLDAIATHHGNKLIRYFYSRAKEQEDPDHGEVSDREFRYPGPRPRSKEMGIIHLADAVEAASRTLQDPNPSRIQDMIDQIVKNALDDGQLDDCELTLKDIEKVGATFFWVLSNALHNRIDYPGFDFNRRGAG